MPQIANWPQTPAEAQAVLESHPEATFDQRHTCKVCNEPYWCLRHPVSHRVRSFCSKRCYYRHNEKNAGYQRYRQSDKGKAMRRQVVKKSAARPEAIAREAQRQRWKKLVLTLDPSQRPERPFNISPWPNCTTDGCHNILPSRIKAPCRYCAWQQSIANRPNKWRNAGKPCKECGKPLTRYQAKYCSPVCSSRAKDKLFRKNNPDAYRAQRRRQRQRRNERRKLKKLEAFDNGEYNIACLECLEIFNAFGFNARKLKFCSRKCSKKHHRTNREMRKRKAFVEAVNVRKLARWQKGRCYHCNRKIDMTKSAPHPKSLTLDHLVPLALGGEHSYANTVASCWDCNCTIKGVGAINEQLKLV